MPPEAPPFRSSSPVSMEDSAIANVLKSVGEDRGAAAGLKDSQGEQDGKPKERQMIGRADQVYDHKILERVRHS